MTDTNNTGMNLYTDGGCRPSSRGFAGWGVHGYSYSLDAPDGKKKLKKKGKDVPTDIGYLIKDDSRANKANVVQPINVYELWKGIPGESTNNVAELQAAARGLSLALDEKVNAVNIYTDSEYVVKNLSNVPKWVKNNWQTSAGDDVKNKEDWINLYKRVMDIKEAGVKFNLSWVAGHAGDKGNTFADIYATRGVLDNMQGICDERYIERSWSDFNNYKANRPRFISFNRWYFTLGEVNNYGKNEHGLYSYYFGNPSKADADEEYWGKASADVAYSVVWLKEPELVLDLIYNRVRSQTKEHYGNIFRGRLDNIYKPVYHREVLEGAGDYVFRANAKRNDFINPARALIVAELNPPNIAYRAVSNLIFLERVLGGFVTNDVSDSEVHYHDITDSFYVKSDKKDFILHAKFKQTTAAIKISAPLDVLNRKGTIPITCSVGIDIPNRNSFNGICGLNPRVTLVTMKESDIAFRFMTIVSCDDGYCIMANISSNLRILSEKEKEI